ncbi:MAG: tetratricopeptide repeat protein [Lentimicrobiaceae bacterium]|nr:tetratricopeptide repeat protein [Lentimicrobiaceae bacterium]MCO5264454.1 tetratricopeptide repeat protein [Lentimicrobium sp.]HPG32805.1 tetratricopeptide repeat protein [Lentimicrobium sp.]
MTANLIKPRTIFLWAFASLLLVTACSTKKNTFTRRAYHNLTAHYNAYWNGNESLKDGISELRKSARDNYTSVLPVYNFGTQSNAQAINPNMDRAIEKASKVIQRHSMVFDKKEHVRWVIYSYMLIGKANFYKQDYNAARRAFEYVSRQYSDEPVKYEAMLWMGRTYKQLKQYDKAITTYDLISSESVGQLLPWIVRKDLPLAYADMFIAQGKYGQAREFLEKAIPLNSNGKLRTRINFILGQIYQKEGKDNRSGEYYTKVIKGSASFEMAFNARINLARVYNANSGDKRLIVKELEKMLRDAKNKDFNDQIYFALAEIALKDKNDTLEVQYLRKSVASSVSNDYQKSTSSLRLADKYFKRPDYRLAQAYYDSAMMFLPKDFPDYEKIAEKTDILTRLVINLQTIHVQDSLQNLAGMPEAERNKIIDKAIAEYIKKEEEAKRKEEEEKLAMMSGVGLQGRQIVDPTKGTTSVGGGGWYFYNPSAISMGFSEFTRKWGRRRLEDNWRLSNKREVNIEPIADESGESPADSTQTASEGGKGSSDMKNRATYLKDLPTTPEKLTASNGLIADGLFNSGIIFLEELFDKPKAIESFHQLITRFPEDKNALQANYHLYRAFRDMGDSTRMSYHKDLIIQNFPESDYAKILIDPNYNVELEAIRNRVKSLYEETYVAFERKQFRTAIIYSNEALSKYTDVNLMPKFAFIRALSRGKTENADTMKAELTRLIALYPASDVVDMARRLLGPVSPDGSITALKEGESNSSNGQAEAKPLDYSMYKVNTTATHFYALVVDGSAVNVYGTKVRITDFNTKNYSVDNLQVNSVLLDNNRQMITISSFGDLDKAKRYFNGIKEDKYVFSGIKEGTFVQFLISAENYPVFFKEKNTDAYLQFFNKNYLKD